MPVFFLEVIDWDDEYGFNIIHDNHYIKYSREISGIISWMEEKGVDLVFVQERHWNSENVYFSMLMGIADLDNYKTTEEVYRR